MSGVAIRCAGLRKSYPGGVEAVRGLDLAIPAGACFGLLGPNGAGKTTTVEILEGLLEPTAGEVEVLGLQWKRDSNRIREQIGVTLQDTRLTEKLTVKETLRLFRSFYRNGIDPEEAIAQVALEEKRNERVGRLSGGQRQRLAVATALIGDPKILFLDEPTTGLDPQSRRQLWDVLRKAKASGKTIVLTTHYMDEAERLCDEVAIIDHGLRIALGSPRDLIASVEGDHIVETSFSDARAAESASAVEAVGVAASSRRLLDRTVEWTVSELHTALPGILDALAASGIELKSLNTRRASLEDVFVRLTGRHLRDENTAAAD